MIAGDDTKTGEVGDDSVIMSGLRNVDDLQNYYDALNELEKQNGSLKAFKNTFSNNDPLDRWPTLFEILNKKTQSPLDLWSFYVYMRDEANSIDYIDFWIDTVQHINLCKLYVQGLRDSLVANSRVREAGKVTNILSSKNNSKTSISIDDIGQPQTKYQNKNDGDDNDSGFNRNSQTSSRNSKSSSLLLELLMKNDLFEEQDPHRLSTFLRGESAIRTSDPVVNAKIDEIKRKSSQFPDDLTRESYPTNATVNNNNRSVGSFRVSKINPEMVEALIQQDFDKKHKSYEKSHLISRSSLRKSSQNILRTYFNDDSIKKIDLPQGIANTIKEALQKQGRDDPEVFDEAREYVFKAMEYDAYPNFLRDHALRNVTRKSAIFRLLGSMISGLAAFWTGYTLIFIDYQPKPTRAVVVIPFFLMAYLFFTAFYRVDPVLCYLGYSESTATPGGIIPLKEPYVRELLRKRSLFVLFILCAVAAAFSILFSLVPGYRLLH